MKALVQLTEQERVPAAFIYGLQTSGESYPIIIPDVDLDS